MDHFFTRNSMGRVFGFLEVNSVRKKWKIYPNFKIPEIFGFLDLGLSLEPDTWLYLFGHGISQTQPMWGHTQNFSSFGPVILYLPGGGWISPPLSLKCVAGTPSLLGLRWVLESSSPGLLKNGKMNLCTSTGSRENNQNKVGTYLWWDTLYFFIWLEGLQI